MQCFGQGKFLVADELLPRGGVAVPKAARLGLPLELLVGFVLFCFGMCDTSD